MALETRPDGYSVAIVNTITGRRLAIPSIYAAGLLESASLWIDGETPDELREINNSLLEEIKTLREEIKTLRQKIVALEEQPPAKEAEAKGLASIRRGAQG